MAVTAETEAEVLRLYRLNPKRFSQFKTSKKVGLSMSEVGEIIARNREALLYGQEHNMGFGRPELRNFIVASRRVTDHGWDNEDPKVREARRRFCLGTHDLATHRDGPWLHLCSVPLNKPRQPRPDYFDLGVA